MTQGGGEEEEMMLQYAIRQSLAQPGDQVYRIGDKIRKEIVKNRNTG